MKLWILRPVDGDAFWEPWYDKCFGFIVRAETETKARALAQTCGGDEKRDHPYPKTRPAWTSPKHSTCTELMPEGVTEVVMNDFHAA